MYLVAYRLNSNVLLVRFLSTPAHEAKAKSDLTLLHALIVELGLCTASSTESPNTSLSNLSGLPRSLRAAKALLKAHVFVNVRDYLDVRNKGFDALQGITR